MWRIWWRSSRQKCNSHSLIHARSFTCRIRSNNVLIFLKVLTFSEDCFSKTVKIFGVEQTIDIIDEGSTENFFEGNERILKMCDCYLIIFSLSDHKTMQDVKDLMEKLYTLKKPEDIHLVLIGNKSDLAVERQCSDEQIDALVNELGLEKCYITSAKLNKGIEEAFAACYYDLYTKMFRLKPLWEKLEAGILPRRCTIL